MGPSRTFELRYYTAKNGRDYYREFLDDLHPDVSVQIQMQVAKLAIGIGEVKSLDNKLWELKVRVGPGYRVYFTRVRNEIVLVLAGSHKRDQDRTIALARRLIREIEF
jgi:putative addiction module killer protein